MNQLEALENQILERVDEEGKAKLLQKEEALANQLEKSRVNGVSNLRAAKERLNEQTSSTLERTIQTLQNQKRDQVLQEKQTMIQSVFSGALDKMKAWDERSFQDFVRQALESFVSKGEAQVLIGKPSEQHFTEAFRNEIMENIPTLSFSKEMISEHGFAVQVGGTTYNFTFDQMIEETKREFTTKVASLAFAKQIDKG